ncbi:MAG: DUF4404 family protein [Elusimicrobiota bacterium]
MPESDAVIKKIEEIILGMDLMDGNGKKELLRLLERLKAEVDHLSQTHGEYVRSITGFAQVAAHEASRMEKPAGLLENALAGLALSVNGFESSHPKLVEIINEICTALAKIGI